MRDGRWNYYFSAATLKEASDVAVISIEPNELFFYYFVRFHLLHALVIS